MDHSVRVSTKSKAKFVKCCELQDALIIDFSNAHCSHNSLWLRLSEGWHNIYHHIPSGGLQVCDRIQFSSSPYYCNLLIWQRATIVVPLCSTVAYMKKECWLLILEAIRLMINGSGLISFTISYRSPCFELFYVSMADFIHSVSCYIREFLS